MKRLFGAGLIILVGLILGALLLAYSQGKRIDGKGKISGTGILQIDSTPDEAKIYVDSKLMTTSDRNIENLSPGKHTVRLEKDHYTTWEKIIDVKEGLVIPLFVTLFPSNPSLTAVTFDGVFAPKLSYDNKKVVFGIQSSTKAGLWGLDLSDPQLFFDNRLKQVVSDSNSIQFSQSTFIWSADNKSILIEAQTTGSTETKNFLLKSDQINSNPEEISDSSKEKTNLAASLLERDRNKLEKLGDEAKTLALDAKSLVFSKDNKAVIITKADNSVVIYDSKPSPVPNTKATTISLTTGSTYFFLQDVQNHIVAIENNTVSVMDRDGTNKVNLFTGDFEPNAVFSWPDGTRLVISINLNSKSNPLPNLYSIELK